MAEARWSSFDRHMMAAALRMARRGLGRTAPNPAVGAIIADERCGIVVARGWTQPGGRPHAETEAIRVAGERARGLTMYVTLEPCSHHGGTPPCADAVVAAGLSRVVVAIEDPDPRVAGRGLDRLRRAGIVAERGLLAEEAHWVTRGHIVRVTERRPFVQLKLALGADGAVPRGAGGRPVLVTGEQARRLGHLCRAQADAILVGRQTVLDDDPALDCRLAGMADRSPIRVVLDRALGLPATARVLHPAASSAPCLVVTGPQCEADRIAAITAVGAEIARVPVVGGALWLPSVLETLAARGITRLLVEGGPAVWRSFSDRGFVDEVQLFHAGRCDAATARAHLSRHIAVGGLTAVDTVYPGEDTLVTFRHTMPARQVHRP